MSSASPTPHRDAFSEPATSAGLYKRSQELIEKTLPELDDKDLRARIAPGVNPILWMIGHDFVAGGNSERQRYGLYTSDR